MPFSPSLPTIHVMVLAAACFFGTTVYAFSLLFAAVIMPGLDALQDDTEYLRAFQVIDGTIQNNQPLFILSWVGSMFSGAVLAVLTTTREPAAMSIRRRLAMVAVCILFLIGHVITVTQNIPRNNALHSLDLDQSDSSTLAEMRQDFVGPWCAYNTARTVLFGLASIYWLVELALVDPAMLVFNTKSPASLSFDSPPEVEARFHSVV